MRPEVDRLELCQAHPQALVLRQSTTPTYSGEKADEDDASSSSSWTHVPLSPPSTRPANSVVLGDRDDQLKNHQGSQNDEDRLEPRQIQELEGSDHSSPWLIVADVPKVTNTASDFSARSPSQSSLLDELTSSPRYGAFADSEDTEPFKNDDDSLENYQVQELQVEDSLSSTPWLVVSVASKVTDAAIDFSTRFQPAALASDKLTAPPPCATAAEAFEATVDEEYQDNRLSRSASGVTTRTDPVASSRVEGSSNSSHSSSPPDSEPAKLSGVLATGTNAPAPARELHPPWDFQDPQPIRDPSLGVPSFHIPRILAKTYQHIVASILSFRDDPVITISDCWDPVYEILGLDPRHLYFNTEPYCPRRNAEEIQIFVSTKMVISRE
ncbi:hypothetical protein NP233_g7392 [Leucocoprinus birnbaumii]|uniref:Uncharacterized protein n=1 Tax=Leucocoprinus birnbaumii TaxID=56174 RepID=A0AAD5YUN1_9AGAR|nr:hypothetical protein NP233_g7392 [Leucocoprinus birnbaumii]